MWGYFLLFENGRVSLKMNSKQKGKLLLGSILTGFMVGVIYICFESAVSHSISYIWSDLFNTNEKRLLVIPITLILSLVYFGAQHILDRQAEKNGEELSPSLVNLGKVLLLGLLSLVAGASLGPEAILVPASTITGALIAKSFLKAKGEEIKLLSAVGLVALFVAFFHTLLGALLGLFLLKKTTGKNLPKAALILVGAASVSTWLALQAFSTPEYFEFPPHIWDFSFSSVLAIVLLVASGVAANYALKYLRVLPDRLHNLLKKDWYKLAVVAGLGLAGLCLIGGDLVQFTGNKSIIPMHSQAATLGLTGLLWVTVVKLGAIAWSKSLGYRGGLIFPMIFVASCLASIAQLYAGELSFIVGMLAVLVGAFYADKKTKVLI